MEARPTCFHTKPECKMRQKILGKINQTLQWFNSKNFEVSNNGKRNNASKSAKIIRFAIEKRFSKCTSFCHYSVSVNRHSECNAWVY